MDGRKLDQRRLGHAGHRRHGGARQRRLVSDERRLGQRFQPRRSGTGRQQRGGRRAGLRRGSGAGQASGAGGGGRGANRGLHADGDESGTFGSHGAPRVGTADEWIGFRGLGIVAGHLQRGDRTVDGRGAGRGFVGHLADFRDRGRRHDGHRHHQPRADRRERSARSEFRQRRGDRDVVRQFPGLDQGFGRGGFRPSRRRDHLRRRGEQFERIRPCRRFAAGCGSPWIRLRAWQLVRGVSAFESDDGRLYRFLDVHGSRRRDQRHGRGLGRRRRRRPGARQSGHRRRRRRGIFRPQDRDGRPLAGICRYRRRGRNRGQRDRHRHAAWPHRQSQLVRQHQYDLRSRRRTRIE